MDDDARARELKDKLKKILMLNERPMYDSVFTATKGVGRDDYDMLVDDVFAFILNHNGPVA